jgi:hypothetical protein
MRHRPPGQAVKAPCARSIVDDLQVKAHLCPPMLVSHCVPRRRCSHPFRGNAILRNNHCQRMNAPADTQSLPAGARLVPSCRNSRMSGLRDTLSRRPDQEPLSALRGRGRDPRRRRGRVRWVPASALESLHLTPTLSAPKGREGDHACGLSGMTMRLRSCTLIYAARYLAQQLILSSRARGNAAHRR